MILYHIESYMIILLQEASGCLLPLWECLVPAVPLCLGTRIAPTQALLGSTTQRLFCFHFRYRLMTTAYCDRPESILSKPDS